MKRDEFLNTISRGLMMVFAGSWVVACSSGDDGGVAPPVTPPPCSGTKVSVALSRMPNVGDQVSSTGSPCFPNSIVL